MNLKQIERIARVPEVQNLMGISRSVVYVRVKQRLLTPPVSLGGQAVGWPASEIAAINTARIAGQSDAEIRELVSLLEAKRKAAITEQLAAA